MSIDRKVLLIALSSHKGEHTVGVGIAAAGTSVCFAVSNFGGARKNILFLRCSSSILPEIFSTTCRDNGDGRHLLMVDV